MEENMDFEFELTPEFVEGAEVEEPAEESAETEEESETETEDAENQSETEDGESLEIKYNGETKRISRDEARTLAQKGMNYDHIKSQHDSLKEENERLSGAAKVLERLARNANQSPEEYLKSLNDRLAAEEEKRQIKDVMTKYGVDEKTARRINQDHRENSRQYEDYSSVKQKLAELELRDKARDTWMSFVREHPEIKTYDELPEEVKLQVKQGKDLTDAYNAYEIKQLRDKLAKGERQAKNKENSAGSVKDSGSSATETDPFLKGFLGNY